MKTKYIIVLASVLLVSSPVSAKENRHDKEKHHSTENHSSKEGGASKDHLFAEEGNSRWEVNSPWYIGAHGEFLWVNDADLERNGTDVGEMRFDLEYAAAVAVGYKPKTEGFLGNTRYELEFMYRQTDLDKLGGVLAPGGLGGSIDTFALMANAYYDFPRICKRWNIRPYIGAGIGLARQEYETLTLTLDDSDDVFAYQAMAGLAYTMEQYPAVTMNIGFRYYGTEDISVRDDLGNRYEQAFDSHAIEYGIRYQF